jgi:hypothetical protein
MSFDSVREAVFATFQDEMAVAQPGVAICYENQKFDQPSGPWFYVAIVPGDSRRAEISSSRAFFHYGIVNVQIMVPQDTGTKRLNELTQAAFNILADRNWALTGGGSLTTYCCKKRNRGLQNGFLTYNLQAEFRHDERLVRA